MQLLKVAPRLAEALAAPSTRALDGKILSRSRGIMKERDVIDTRLPRPALETIRVARRAELALKNFIELSSIRQLLALDHVSLARWRKRNAVLVHRYII